MPASHKSCLSTRKPCKHSLATSGTNTVESKQKVHRLSIEQEINPIDQKFQKIRAQITSVITKELDDTARSRCDIFEKFDKIDAKINSMIEFQNNVLAMRETLSTAQNTLEDLYQRIGMIEVTNELNSIKVRKAILKPMLTEEEAEEEMFSSEIAPAADVTS